MLLQNLLRCKKKKINNNKEIEGDIDDYMRCWDDGPCINLEDIMAQLNLVDCIRASNVCKSWRSLAVNRKNKIKTAQLPWLVLSHPCTKSLRFFDFSLGSFYNISLPRSTLFRWWYCGSSKGWLVIAKGWYFNPKLVLFNPNSGVQLQLPRLRTIPSFKDFLSENKYANYDITHFIEKIELSCSCEDTSNDCIVAASFYNQTTLALCRPGDKSWSVFKGGVDQINICDDILFYNGILYALIRCLDEDQDRDADAFAEAQDHSMRIGDDDIVVVVKLIPLDVSLRTSCLTLDPHIRVPANDFEGEWIVKNVGLISYLVESDGKLLIVHRIKNAIGSSVDPDGHSDLDLMVNEYVEMVVQIKRTMMFIIITMMILTMLMTMLIMDMVTTKETIYVAICIMMAAIIPFL
ncbi:hypothetical protein Dsin_023953 [Dipteronia sinensis]|uniref:F-box domain-containing protein n=1 Tax=Dipteronia sinensis TaxID=43782 RepID=A0AAE0A4M3_9ROSI|nr:hypothetical protein Dsin_023953 [Dipteronia sinensis]